MLTEPKPTSLLLITKYYERMRSEDPGLLAHNVNTWLERTPAQRMIRVLDGKAMRTAKRLECFMVFLSEGHGLRRHCPAHEVSDRDHSFPDEDCRY